MRQIADLAKKCMHDLITNHYPPDPPIPHPFNNPSTSQSLPPDFQSVTDIYGDSVKPFYSYGKELMTDSALPLFTMMLLRCLADKPEDRPSLEELEAWAQIVEADASNNEPDGFYQEAFRPPAPPQLP